MPEQETFFEREVGNLRVEVLKTYDQHYAREVFEGMEPSAQDALWRALRVTENYSAEELPERNASDWQDLLWEELLEDSREDWNLLSFFVVNEGSDGSKRPLYVTSGWPDAERFAECRLNSL
jgi:hypothetical protein